MSTESLLRPSSTLDNQTDTTATDTILSTAKKQRNSTTSPTDNSQFVTIAPASQPIYLVEWLGNDIPLQPLYGFTVSNNPPTPVKTQATSIAPASSPPPDSPSPLSVPNQTTFNTPSVEYPSLHVDSIMAVHKKTLPRDILPGQFLIDIVKQNTGRIILACQFANCNDTGNQHHDFENQVPNSSHEQPNQSLTNDHTSIQTPPTGPQVTVLGCVAGLYIQFWSRRGDAEFKMRRILNIFSIFVDDTISSRGIGSSLMDGLIYIFEDAVIKREGGSVGITGSFEQKVGGDSGQNDQNDHKENHRNNPLSSFPGPNPYTSHKSRWFLTPFDEISLEVRSSNAKAIAFYKSRGFSVENTENGYYPQGVTAADRRMHEMVVDFSEYKYSNPNLIEKLKQMKKIGQGG